MRSVKKLIPLYVASVLFVTAAAYVASKCVDVYIVASASELRDPKTVFVVDAGHGGEDGGAVSANGTRESDLNLEISLRLRDLLRFLGYPVEMTREADVSIHGKEAKSISEKKVSDLKNRVRFADQYDSALLVSIHQNMFSESKYKGAQVFYADRSTGKALAERMQAEFNTSLDPSNHRAAKESKSVYLLNKVRCPAILVECGFLSNPQEEAQLRTSAYQKKLALTIAAVLTTYGGSGAVY